jgi:hypothetical protein
MKNIILLVTILGNVLALLFDFYSSWMGWLLGIVIVAYIVNYWKIKKSKFVLKEEKDLNKFVKKEEKEYPRLFKVLHVLAYAIPLFLLLFVFYINYLPFGYSKDYSISVLDDGTVVSSSPEIYLEDLKGRKITNLTDVYDYGSINLVVKPKVVLRNALVNASITGDDVYFAKTNFSVTSNDWDYFWNFSAGIPNDLKGAAKYNEDLGCVYFNGSNNETLYYPNSSDMFENDSFVVYAKWKPMDSNGKNQQIIGHYNWELWQGNSSVRFMIGRLDNENGNMPSISFPVDESFFNETHETLVVYITDNHSGYIELYVDGNFSGRKTILNQTIWNEYNSNMDLTSGWSPHNYKNNSYYSGCVYSVGFDYNNINYLQNVNFSSNEESLAVPVVGNGNFNEIDLHIAKKGLI